MSNLRKTLKEMAQLSLLSHRISSVQEKNLKMFPFVFFEGVKTVSIDYDLGHGINEETKEVNHGSFIAYHIHLDDSINTSLPYRFSSLETAVRELFWKDIIVEVHFNGKKVFESKHE